MTAEDEKFDTRRQRNLILGLAFDCIGMMSYSMPLVAEVIDIVWAPISGLLMARMYKGTAGKIGAVVSFAEEILPGTDFIPSFTLMWIYTYLLKGRKAVPRS